MTSITASLVDRARAWAEIANHAPSGDNSQPWTVSLGVADGRIELRLGLDEATRTAPSIFDCGFAASFLALGAFARNFSLLAAEGGFGLVDLREDSGVFRLTFAPVPGVAPAQPSVATAVLIRRRLTNRLPFRREALGRSSAAALEQVVHDAGNGLVLQEFGGKERDQLAAVFADLDRFRYRHAGLYDEFLGKLRFGAESDRSPDGLRDSTLGVPAPSLLFLRLLRALRGVRVVRGLFFSGLDRVMAFFGCVFLIRRSAGVFILSGGDDSPLGWFRLGYCFQHVWLEATRQGLALQPLGTTLLLYRLTRSDGSADAAFTPAQQGWLRETADRLRGLTGLDLGGPAIAFRLGRGPACAAQSPRRPVQLAIM